MNLVQYTGPIDINCIVSSKDHKPYGIEWTARPGYSAIYAMIRLLDLKKMDLSEHLYGIATGELKEWAIKPGFGYAMRVSIPPYPLAIQNDKLRNDLFKQTEGLKISNYDDSFVPLDVRKKDDGFESAGIDGVIGEITGYGLTIEEAKNDAHSRFKRLKVPQKQSRLDGWKRPIKDLETLKAWGFEMPEVNKGDNHE
jgi:phosphoribosylamine-glycine ligase